MPRDPHAYLEDMLRAATLIQRIVGGQTRADYFDDLVARSAVERQLTIIGEALVQLGRVDESLASSVSDRRKIIGLRNILVHGYADVDPALVWDMVREDLPTLMLEVTALLEE